MNRTASVVLGVAALLALTGCRASIGGDVELAALGARPLVLERGLTEGVYDELDAEYSFWFSDVPFESLAKIDRAGGGGAPLADAVFVHAQLVWKPEPGRTPLSATATNLVTRVIIVSNGEVGLYGGAGFARPRGELGAETLELDLRGGTLTLLAKTDGFHDLLSPTSLTGVVTARRSPEDAARWRRGVSQFATNALKRPMWVLRDDAGTDAVALSRR